MYSKVTGSLAGNLSATDVAKSSTAVSAVLCRVHCKPSPMILSSLSFYGPRRVCFSDQSQDATRVLEAGQATLGPHRIQSEASGIRAWPQSPAAEA